MSELNDKAIGVLAEIFIRAYIHALPKVIEGFGVIPGLQQQKSQSLVSLSQLRCTELIAHVANINQSRLVEAVTDIASGCASAWHQDDKAMERVLGRFTDTVDGLLTEWKPRLQAVIEKRWATLDDQGKRMLLSSPLYPERDQTIYGFLY